MRLLKSFMWELWKNIDIPIKINGVIDFCFLFINIRVNWLCFNNKYVVQLMFFNVSYILLLLPHRFLFLSFYVIGIFLFLLHSVSIVLFLWRLCPFLYSIKWFLCAICFKHFHVLHRYFCIFISFACFCSHIFL